LLFPIQFEGKVVAVLFIGQIKHEEDVEIIAYNKRRYLAEHPDIFDDYLKNEKVQRTGKTEPEMYNREAIFAFVRDQERHDVGHPYLDVFSEDVTSGRTIPAFKDVLTKADFDSIMHKVSIWIDELEGHMDREMRRKREECARIICDEAFRLFYAHFSESMHKNHSIKRALWAPIQVFLDHLVAHGGIAYVAAFSVGDLGDREAKKLLSVVTSPQGNARIWPREFSLLLPAVKRCNTPISSIARNNTYIFDAFTPTLPVEAKKQLAIFLPNQIRAASLAMLVIYKNESIQDAIEKTLDLSLSNFAAQLSSWVTVRFEHHAQDQLKKMLRLYKHEIINLAKSVEYALAFLGDPSLKTQSDDKIHDVFLDTTETLELFRYMADNLGMMIKDPQPARKETVRIYQKLLNKWANIMRLDSIEKGCDFVMDDHTSFYVHTDRKYLELIVYNLFMNAVKYSHAGTNIYVHLKKKDFSYKYVLSVTNYAMRIPKAEERRIFEMGYRADNATDYYPEGTGIGLWLVRKAASLLGGKAHLCKQERISEYNIPLLHALFHEGTAYNIPKGGKEYLKAEKEYKKLRNTKYVSVHGKEMDAFSLVLPKQNRRVFMRKEINYGLREPTYMIRFEVEF
jgi:hypothetical protein